MRVLPRSRSALVVAFVLALLVAGTTPAQDSMYVEQGGEVGIGTSSPTATLHVLRTDGTAKILVEDASATAASRSLFVLRNSGQINFSLFRVDGSNGIWSFTHNGNQFTISKAGTGANEFSIFDNGDVEARGTITGSVASPSSRSLKSLLAPVDPQSVLERVAALPIVQWQYKIEEDPRLHIGPTAEDFNSAFQVGDSDKIFLVDANGVALAAIQGLHQMLQDKEQRIQHLERENERLKNLETELARLRMLIEGPNQTR